FWCAPWCGYCWQVAFTVCGGERLSGNRRGSYEELRRVDSMPREAKLFASSSGSVVRGYLKFRANITPRWIRNARTSRKRVEPEIVRSLRMLRDLKKNRPRARRSAIEHAGNG